MKPHPHAEFFRAIADGEPLENWEARIDGQERWKSPANLSTNIMTCHLGAQVRRKPTPTVTKRVIDWPKLGRHVPVKVCDFDPDGDQLVMMPALGSAYLSHRKAWEYASLDTGLWVFNADGVNPWPDGVVVKTTDRDGYSRTDLAEEIEFALGRGGDTIIASRFHSLEEGWSFGHE